MNLAYNAWIIRKNIFLKLLGKITGVPIPIAEMHIKIGKAGNKI